MQTSSFAISEYDRSSRARLGTLTTGHGVIETPAFMPVGTKASVKAMTHDQLEEAGAQIILGNTYHLMLRPGMDIIAKAGGLHAFMSWNKPLLTDSGGFQVFSLAALNKISQQGVEFQSHIDGSRHFLGPNESMQVQKTLGSDIVMAFDQCCHYPCSYEETKAAMERTHQWAEVCRRFPLQSHQQLFGIVQGGMYGDLRRESCRQLTSLPFDGFALGGLSVGEPQEMMYEMIDVAEPLLPADKPRYLMGVGTPRNIIEAVMRGIDLFDCVMPTRNARNGTVFTWSGKLSIKAGRYAEDFSPLDPELNCYASRFSKAYIRHLINSDEITGLTLATQQNVTFYLEFMRRLRQAIRQGTLRDYYHQICALYPL